VQFAIPPNAVSPQTLVPFALQPGQVLNALVLQLLEDGQVRLSIANTVMDVVSQVPLTPGAAVRLAVQTTTPVLTLAVVEPGSAARAASASGTSTPATVNEAAAASATSNDSTALAPVRNAAPSSPAVALAQAVRSAALRQGGLAPLFADVGNVERAPVLPVPVRAAMTQLLALRMPAAGPVTAAQVEQAFSQSGLFLEARVAGTIVAQASTEADATTGTSRADVLLASANVKPGTIPSDAPVAPDLKAALVVLRQVLSNWLGTMPAKPEVASPPLQPNPAPADAAPTPPGQPSVVANPKAGAEAKTAGAATDGTVPAETRAVRAAVTAAAEIATRVARVVATPADGSNDRTPAGPAMQPEPATATAPAALAAARLAAIVREDRNLLAPLGLLAPNVEPDQILLHGTSEPARAPAAPAMSQAADRSADQPTNRPAAPPPPYGGAPTTAQPPAAAAVSADAAPRVIGERLLSDTDAALARQTLLQAASLPDGAQSQRDSVRWVFEVPFATPQGTAVAQFEIARDGRGGSAREAQPAWRARFTLDVEPIGPVHAQIALNGTRAAVTLWAEREASATRLRTDAGLLSQALIQAELEPGDVLVRTGEPPRPPEPAGRFLDRAS